VREIDAMRSPGQAPASDARFVTLNMAIFDASDPLERDTSLWGALAALQCRRTGQRD